MLERWRIMLKARWADSPPPPVVVAIPKPLPPTPPPVPEPSFAERFAAEWRRQWGRTQTTRAQIEEARAEPDAAQRRAQEDELIRQVVASGGVLWRSDQAPTLPGFGRMQSFEEYTRGNVLDGDA